MTWRFGFIAAILLQSACAGEPPALTISAAANLQPAFAELAARFERESGARVVFNYGATGSLAQQIAQGAPVDLFASADRATIDDLAARGLIVRDSVRVYARGRLVIYTGAASSLKVQTLAELTQPTVHRIAIANPARAPYGLAARSALQRAGVWSAVEPKIIVAENIQQTLQYADTASVDVALVALSLALGAPGNWSLVPTELHPPIEQALGVVKSSRRERQAREFAALVLSESGQMILKRHGYESPDK